MVRVNIHIDADSLIRDNRERFRLPARVSAGPPLHVQNIITWRQRSTIISVCVSSNPRDFFFFASTQDEQWIVSVVFRRHRRRVFIAEVDRVGRKNLQMSLHDARRQSITRCSTTSQHQKDASNNQVLEEHRLPRGASRRGRFSLPRHEKLNSTAVAGSRHRGRALPHRAPARLSRSSARRSRPVGGYPRLASTCSRPTSVC
jgi:hypothetical protein